MKKQHDYQIYALIAGKNVFVGKTTAKNVKSIYWRHLRGENRYTRAYFARGLPVKPEMYTLTKVHTDFSIAYRYVVAFVRIFLDESYTVLNSPGILEDANDIHEMTQKIFDDLKAIPLRQRLETDGGDETNKTMNLEKVTAAPTVKGAAKEKASEKLTIRLTAQEKESFTDYAQEIGVTQRQAVQLLLVRKKYDDALDGDFTSDEYIKGLLKVYREENANLEKEIAQLKSKINKLERKETGELKAKEKFVREGIAEFFGFFDSSKRGNSTLEQGIYREINKSLQGVNGYRYPAQEGFFLFFPEQILLGRGRFAPLFILGEDEHGNKMQLRYYPKAYFTGFSFTNEKFGLEDSAWFVGVERAKDGAMDLVLALPVDIQRHGGEAGQEHCQTVNDLIEDAQKRLECYDFLGD